MYPTIEKFMTPLVHTVRAGATFAEAHALMRRHGIRHLPVLEGGRLVGIVSERDLYLLETFGAGGAKEIAVEEGMSQDVLAVPPSALAGEVARTMAERKLGSAVIARDGHVLGIFTTVDALRVLAGQLSAQNALGAGSTEADSLRWRSLELTFQDSAPH